METPQADAPLVIASLLIVAVLLASAVLWIRKVQRPQELIAQDLGVAPWTIGWVNFGIFFCAMVIAVFGAQQIGISLYMGLSNESTLELTPWLAVLSVILLQVPMFAVFYLARRLYPGHYADRLSQIEDSIGDSFKKAVPLFIMFLPIIWIATLAWSGILKILAEHNVIEEFAPQEIITLFQGGGDLVAIFILVFLAVVLAPIVEEIIFRGCIYRFLKSQTTMLSAQILSGAFFAFMHGNTLSFLPLVIVGLLLARVYEKTGSIAVAIWFHAFFNAFSLSMLFITGMSENIPTNY